MGTAAGTVWHGQQTPALYAQVTVCHSPCLTHALTHINQQNSGELEYKPVKVLVRVSASLYSLQRLTSWVPYGQTSRQTHAHTHAHTHTHTCTHTRTHMHTHTHTHKRRLTARERDTESICLCISLSLPRSVSPYTWYLFVSLFCYGFKINPCSVCRSRSTIVSTNGNSTVKDNIANIFGPKQVLLLLRSNVCMIVSDLKVAVLDELGSGLRFLLGSPHLVPEVSPRWPQACSFECVGCTVL